MSKGADIAAGALCPAPIHKRDTVLLAHGGGGRLMRQLIEQTFATAFGNPLLDPMHDGAILEVGAGRLAVTTDSFVVSPMFFPGGNIGSLAVHGTVNDLAMCGATPLALSAGYILEEGLAMTDLERVVAAMKSAAAAVPVPIATGDTKVVERGKGDGIFINTTGIGVVAPGVDIDPRRAEPGDVVLVSGPIAVHGVAIMSVREGITFETSLESDSAPLNGLVAAALAAGGAGVHVLRDPTRGGVASTLCEVASSAGVGIVLHERELPVPEQVAGACALLGLDPLYVANEGNCLIIVSRDRADAVLEAIRRTPQGAAAVRIGEVVDSHPGRVVLTSAIGGSRVVDMLSGEQLPRIC